MFVTSGKADLPDLRRRKGAMYLRLSEGDDLERQRRICTKLMKARGWDLVDTYEDPDESASRYNRRQRTDFTRLLRDLKKGRVTGVVTYDSDRLVRQPKELETLIDLVEYRDVELVHEKGIIDLHTDDGKAGARIACVFAARESDAQSRRWRGLHRDRAERGLPSGGGRRAFGYEKGGMAVDPIEAEIILAARDQIFAGASCRTVVRALTAAGIRTPAGNQWSLSAFRRMITNARLAGIREHCRLNPETGRREVLNTYEAKWPPIISKEDHVRLKAKLSTEVAAGVSFARKHLLAGICWCGRCDLRLTGNKAQGRYMCQTELGCRRCSAQIKPLEDLIVVALIDHVDSRRLGLARAKRGAARATDKRRDPVQEIERLKERMKILSADYYVREAIDEVSFLGAREGLEKALREAEAEAAELVPEEAASLLPDGPLREEWDTYDIERQRAILRAEIVKAVLTPGRRGSQANFPLKDRVDIEWRVPPKGRRPLKKPA